MKVLIVDDEPDFVTFLSTWLEDQGYQTCSAADGHQGLQAVASERPDLVLLDLNMPNQSGFQLYRDLRKADATRRLPVIFITGLSEYQIFSNGCETLPEPDAYLEKPVDLQALRQAIEKIFG